MRKRKGNKLLAPCLILLLFSASAAQGAVSSSGAFFHWGGITHVTKPDGAGTGYTIDLGLPSLPDPSSLGGLTVQVTGPNGFSQTYPNDTPYLSTSREYAEIRQEFPYLTPGLYSFTVSDGQGNRSTRTDALLAPQLMPVVDVTTLQWSRRANGGYRVTWRPVGSEKPYYYRLTVLDAAGNGVHSGNRTFDSADEIAPGVLTDGGRYRARVEVHDAPTFDLLNNRSNSSWATFTPAVTDYDPSRVVSNYAFAVNRYGSSGVLTDFNFGMELANAPLTSATVSGPNGFFYPFDLAADRLKNRVPNSNSTDYYKQWSHPLPPGPYLFEWSIGGVVHKSYATLAPVVELPAIDESTLAAGMVDNATVRFSWADTDRTGTRYYRVMIQDGEGNQGNYFSTARVAQTFIDVPISQFSALGSNRQWRVEIFDSSSGIAARNRRSGNFRPLVIEPYDATAPQIASCQIAHVVDSDLAPQTFVGAAHTSGSVDQFVMNGPDGFVRDLLLRNGYREQGTAEPGLYRCTVTDGNGKSAVSYNYHTATLPLFPVDIRSVNISADPYGGLQLSWAPFHHDVPLWFAVEFFRNSRVDGKIRETQFTPEVLPQILPAADLPDHPGARPPAGALFHADLCFRRRALHHLQQLQPLAHLRLPGRRL